jgi:hypothetical protein
MHSVDTLDRMAAVAKRKNATATSCNWRWAWRTAALSLGLCLAAAPARAVDGCTVLLCFAAPNWRAISQCVPPITQVLRDLARGRAFPTCAMAGASNSASHQWASAPGNCPPQYTRVGYAESSPIYSCDFTGAVSVSIDGVPWARTWWSFGGKTVTEFAPGAKTQLGTWNTQFDDDYAAWLALQPPPVDPCTACGG